MTKIVENNAVNEGQSVELPRTSPDQTTSTPQMSRSTSDRVSAPRKRFHFDTAQAKLAVYNKEEGFHYHWINDTGGRLDLALDSGYEFVKKDAVDLAPGVTPRNSDLGDRVSQIVGKKEDGSPLRAYLMRTPDEYYKESREQLNSQVDATDAAIRKGKASGREDSNFYTPKSDPISVKSKLGNL